MNSNSMKKYEQLKQKDYPNVDKKMILKLKNKTNGTESFFNNLTNILSKRKTYTIDEISKIYNKSLLDEEA